MSGKTIKLALVSALEDLTKDNFDKFCHQLLDRREAPRVKRNKVESKSRLEIADVLVSHFTEEGALRVTVALLKAIGCRNEAEELASSEAAGAAGGSKTAGGKDFVEKHRGQLIQRVSNIALILDELLDKEVIQQETYTRIRALSTSQEKMRELYSGPLQASAACKKIFYDSLLENEKPLVKELSEKD
ncbi:apoptosis-associated speck-like protein containing a CARD [Neolamprologus brichardi]|uniref:apoptosis-associated speck-like protein containing a CARD n=1 Tax=Neolamprologus brichardi TaxID=32507 RepID=UPI0003EC5913|nr:apoptosis-associated speck-like protein containing a CARD [Neolamprologus brichardi]